MKWKKENYTHRTCSALVCNNQSQLLRFGYEKTGLHFAVRLRKHPVPKYLAVMVEIEPINRKQDLICQLIVLLSILLRRVHPILQLRLTNDAIAIQLVTSTHKHMEWLFVVLCHQVRPDGVVTGLETGSAEIVRIDSSRESVTLHRERVVKRRYDWWVSRTCTSR